MLGRGKPHDSRALANRMEEGGTDIMLSRWLLVALLGLEAHFAASYLVPLDERSANEFGGLLRWVWPWAYGDVGLLGRITPSTGFPIVGLYVAMVAAGLLMMAALAAAGWWLPATWWPLFAASGTVALLCLLVLFAGPTKILPIAIAVGTVYLAVSKASLFATS
jgi:hypothetical protein